MVFLGYQQFENNVIGPAIVGSAVNLTPPDHDAGRARRRAAAGVPGALVATPLLGAAKALYLDRRGELPAAAGAGAHAPAQARALERMRGRS